MTSRRVHPGRVIGAPTSDGGQGYEAIVIDARGREKGDCDHADDLEELAMIEWCSLTVVVWLCRGCDELVYRARWTSPGLVSTKAGITGEVTLQAIELGQERLTLRRWASAGRSASPASAPSGSSGS